MKYGIVENNTFILIGDNEDSVNNTANMMDRKGQVISYNDNEVEQAYDGSWYLLGHAPEKPQALIDQEHINELQAYLDSTDWYAVRYAETGVAIPENVASQRASAREEISTLRVEGVI